MSTGFEEWWATCAKHGVRHRKTFRCALCQLEEMEMMERLENLSDEDLKDDRLENRGEDDPAAA